MTRLHPDEPPPNWGGRGGHKRMWEHVMACAAMLNLHDFMTDGERRKVNARIKAWLKKHNHGMARP